MRPISSALAFIAFVATTVVTADDDDPPAWLGKFNSPSYHPHLSAIIINADLRLEASIEKDDSGVDLEITRVIEPPNYEEDQTCKENVGITIEGKTACGLTSVRFEKLKPDAKAKAIMTLRFGNVCYTVWPERFELETLIYELPGKDDQPEDLTPLQNLLAYFLQKTYGSKNRLNSFDANNFALKSEGQPTQFHFKWLTEIIMQGVESAGAWGGSIEYPERTTIFATRPIILSTSNLQAFFATWDAL